MPTVIVNWLNNLIGSNPNKNGLNLIGLLMTQVRTFQVTPADEQSVVGQWFLASQSNLNQAIAYLTTNVGNPAIKANPSAVTNKKDGRMKYAGETYLVVRKQMRNYERINRALDEYNANHSEEDDAHAKS
ncbi:hypothetical protein M3M38_07385 [Fructilactobacillus cliffordii]|uniref:hypothetical protein n=1 Tax=Fructilactobacillus cliffordii TaxID=2940299 RepID=UPI0020923C07|nr:hypothetical protein [Fructilactobacillus cliffordii]USS86482.1 hypothetical protein M3M38_07385 [Fructilactobacillus cliffordii]